MIKLQSSGSLIDDLMIAAVAFGAVGQSGLENQPVDTLLERIHHCYSIPSIQRFSAKVNSLPSIKVSELASKACNYIIRAHHIPYYNQICRICPNDKWQNWWKSEACSYPEKAFIRGLVVYVIACEEVGRRTKTMEPWQETAMKVAWYHSLKTNDYIKLVHCPLIRKVFGVDPDRKLAEAFKRDEEEIAKLLIGVSEADKIQVGEFLYEHLKELYNTKLRSHRDLIRSLYEEDKDITYYLLAVKQKVKKKLTPYERIQKVKKRLKEKGVNETEISCVVQSKKQVFRNVQHPIPIVIWDRGDESKEQLGYGFDYAPQEMIIAYVETKQLVITSLMQRKERLAKNANVERAFIGYILENFDNDEADFSNRGIAKALECNEQVVGRIRKRLQREVPVIRRILD